MSGSAFTPGPWSRHPFSNPEVRPCEALGEAFRFADTHIGAGDRLVAEVRMQRGSNQPGYPTVECEQEMAANADLIVAAPDMHKALEDARSVIDGLQGQFDHAGCTCTFPDNDCCSYARADSVIAAIDAALAKARGEA